MGNGRLIAIIARIKFYRFIDMAFNGFRSIDCNRRFGVIVGGTNV